MLQAIVQGDAMTCPPTAPSQFWQESRELSEPKVIPLEETEREDEVISFPGQLSWELPYRKEYC